MRTKKAPEPRLAVFYAADLPKDWVITPAGQADGYGRFWSFTYEIPGVGSGELSLGEKRNPKRNPERWNCLVVRALCNHVIFRETCSFDQKLRMLETAVANDWVIHADDLLAEMIAAKVFSDLPSR